MGGSAFASRDTPLYTPRMPKHVYEHVKAHCHDMLRQHYFCVASPIEGPAKADFGDIDILVAWPKVEDKNQTQLQTVAGLLGATDVIPQGSNLAIPWPKELDVARGSEQPKHIQVDVRVCRTLENLEWMLLKHAHGDIWNILGSIMRPYGLTIDDKALFIRIPEVEKFNKTKAKFFLTAEPSEVLQFLSLPIGSAWDRPFASLNDMFEYVSQCPMFWAYANQRHDESPANNTDVASDCKSLKSNDRRRMRKRPAFMKWIDDFMPECRQQGRFLKRRTTREEITNEAISRFHVGDEYHTRKKEALLERQRDLIFRDLIKGTIPQPDGADTEATLFRGCQIKALKKIILEGDTAYGVTPESDLMDDDGFFDFDRTADFIVKNKDEVGRAAILLHHQRYEETLAQKAKNIDTTQ
ncbi:hypothetical protein EsDP_00000727 [Epichloe bromicola]|uniref:Polymerase nucleotidyl transferase domain-containing protein n=1 Tax=Epichloe bromicola TaxID=79588 RepID=A0ABQ0CFS5_9HYPO